MERFKHYRLHITIDQITSTELYKTSNASRVAAKPRGIWYACGTEWLERDPMTIVKRNWLEPSTTTNDLYLYHFETDMSNVLQIETPSQFDEFQIEYGVYDPVAKTYHNIRWNEVEERYKGIQICPYMYKVLEDIQAKGFRFASQDEENDFNRWQNFYHKSSWYEGWDVASGCIWDSTAISNVILVATKKQGQSTFEIWWPALNKIQSLQRNRSIHPSFDIP